MKELLEKLNKTNEESVRAQHDTTDAVLHQSHQLESLKKTTEESGKYTRINSLLASQQINKIEQLNNTVLAGLTAEQKNILDQQRREKAAAQQRMYQEGLTGRAAISSTQEFQSSLHKQTMKAGESNRALLEKSLGIASSQFNIRKIEVGVALKRFLEQRKLTQLQITRDRLLLSNVLAIREHLVGSISSEMAAAELQALQNLVTQITIMDRNGFDRWLWRKELAQSEKKDRMALEARERDFTKKRDQRRESIDNKNKREAKIDAEEIAQEQRNQNQKVLGAIKKGGESGSLMGGAEKSGGIFETLKNVDLFADILQTLAITSASGAVVRNQLQKGKPAPDKTEAERKKKGGGRTPAAPPKSGRGGGRLLGKAVPGAFLGISAFDALMAAREVEKRLEENQFGPRLPAGPTLLENGEMQAEFQKEFGISVAGGLADFMKETALKQKMFPVPFTEEEKKKALDFSVTDKLREKSEGPMGAFMQGTGPLVLLGMTQIAARDAIQSVKDFLTPYHLKNERQLRRMRGEPSVKEMIQDVPVVLSVKEITDGSGATLMRLASAATGNVNNYYTTEIDNSSFNQSTSQINNRAGARTPITTGSASGSM